MAKKSNDGSMNPKGNNHPIIKNAQKLTFSQRASDRLTKICGSWGFIFCLSSILIVWMILNITGFILHWDPYPFILLNLFLSCLATYQAPIILMSQNRAAERDRIVAKYDYQVNRKAEREIENMQQDLEQIKIMIGGCGKRRNK